MSVAFCVFKYNAIQWYCYLVSLTNYTQNRVPLPRMLFNGEFPLIAAADQYVSSGRDNASALIVLRGNITFEQVCTSPVH